MGELLFFKIGTTPSSADQQAAAVRPHLHDGDEGGVEVVRLWGLGVQDLNGVGAGVGVSHGGWGG
jgi:hypothetical protein